MTTYLVSGCAGFIGTTFVHYMLKKYTDIRIVNLDALTYAGNLENLKDLEDDPRHIFVHGNICDAQLVARLIADYDPDYIINFAAESHVDRSIANPEIFVTTNVMGTVNLLQRAKEAWYDAASREWRKGKKYIQVSTDEVYGALGATGYFTEETPINPHSPYSSSKASADHFVKAFHVTYGMPVNITRCSNNYGQFQFPEKLIPLMINNAKNHKALPVYGDGMQIRDWLYVEDHCKVHAINAVGTQNIADTAKAVDAKMVYISTDYVFDGQGERPWEPDDKCYAPLNVYGQSKLDGELAVANTLEKFFIVRIAWVFGLNGKNFIKTMINVGKTHDTVRVVNDQIGTPTYTLDLARLLVDMIETEKYGYYHATNEGGFISWYDFCVEFYKQYGLNTIVIPVTTAEYGLSVAARPFNSRLDKSKLVENGFQPLPTWQDAVSRYLKEAAL